MQHSSVILCVKGKLAQENYRASVTSFSIFLCALKQPAFSNFSGLRTFLKELHFCDKLVSIAGPTIAIKLCFQIYLV